jgi:hypothetical protein
MRAAREGVGSQQSENLQGKEESILLVQARIRSRLKYRVEFG